MNSEVSIIGGGIVGTLIALKLSDSGYNITIYESNKKLGGALKDIENDSGLFLNGCKALNADTQHINNLLNIDSLNLKVFSHNYGSFTDMFGNPIEFVMNAKVFTSSFSVLILTLTKIKTFKSRILRNIKRSIRPVSFLFYNRVTLGIFSFIRPIGDMIFNNFIVQFYLITQSTTSFLFF